MFIFQLDSIECPDFESAIIFLISRTFFISKEFKVRFRIFSKRILGDLLYFVMSKRRTKLSRSGVFLIKMADSISDTLTPPSIVSLLKCRDSPILVLYRNVISEITSRFSIFVCSLFFSGDV